MLKKTIKWIRGLLRFMNREIMLYHKLTMDQQSENERLKKQLEEARKYMGK